MEKQFNETKYARMIYTNALMIARKLYDDGYRQVSNKFRIVARVDIPIQQMKEFFIQQNYGRSNCGVPSCTVESQSEHYRRCYSKDAIEGVPFEVMRFLRKMTNSRNESVNI
jgi:hypothetical protein